MGRFGLTAQPMFGEARSSRSWISAIAWSLAVTAALIGVAVGLNLILGRTIHWDIVSILGAAGLVVFVLGRRTGFL